MLMARIRKDYVGNAPYDLEKGKWYPVEDCQVRYPSGMKACVRFVTVNWWRTMKLDEVEVIIVAK